MSAAAPTPFAFDTEFDASGAVVASSGWRPAKRAYNPAEVDALVAQARADAREAALAETRAIADLALGEIGRTLALGLPGLAGATQSHREASAELALTVGRVLAGAALDRLPRAPLMSALEAMGQEIDAAARLVVRARNLDDQARAELQAVAADAGFSGQVSFRDEPGMTPAAFRLEWADGRVAFDPAEAAERIANVLHAALAAEGGHGEPLSPPNDHGAA